MAKFKIEYENGEEKRTLTFRGVDFDFSMVPASPDEGCTKIGNKVGLDTQVEEHFLEDEDMEEIAGLIENLNFETSSEDIEETLEELEQLE